MNDTIAAKLNEIEARENVQILHAVESGSRAWGFESPDSDYDVRFIYVHPKEFYLKLDSPRDVIEWQLDEILDINGWDLNKALRLLHGSNTTLFEWAASPIVYKTRKEWTKVENAMDDYFRVTDAMFHYLSTATRNYRHYIKDKEVVRLKKYLYVLRPLLAASYVLHTKRPAPMLFSELVDTQLPDAIKPLVADLTAQKMALLEIGTGMRVSEIDRYIEQQIEQLTASAHRQPKSPPAHWDALNQLFLSVM